MSNRVYETKIRVHEDALNALSSVDKLVELTAKKLSLYTMDVMITEGYDAAREYIEIVESFISDSIQVEEAKAMKRLEDLFDELKEIHDIN